MVKHERESGFDSSDLYDPAPSSRDPKIRELPRTVMVNVLDIAADTFNALARKLEALGSGAVKSSNLVEHDK